MNVSVYRDYSVGLDEETGIEPLTWLRDGCAKKSGHELDPVGSLGEECDECGVSRS